MALTLNIADRTGTDMTERVREQSADMAIREQLALLEATLDLLVEARERQLTDSAKRKDIPLFVAASLDEQLALVRYERERRQQDRVGRAEFGLE